MVLVVLSATVPKATAVADSVVGTFPDPVSFTVCPLLLALSVMVRVSDCAPVASGVKVKERVQLAPPANGVLVEQVVAGPRANSVPFVKTRELNVRG